MKTLKITLISLVCLAVESQAGVSVDPVQMYISNQNNQKTTTVTLEFKDETENKIFEVNAFKWTQKDNGENVLEPDNTLILNPKNFFLKPNSKQTIRVGFKQSLEAILDNKQEATWRIMIDEIPQATKESSVNFLLSFNLPLFVGKQENINLKFSIKNNNLNVLNQSKSHIQINNFKIVDLNKNEVFKADTMTYLLANKSNNFDLNGVKITDPKKYRVQFFTDKNDNMVELPLFD